MAPLRPNRGWPPHTRLPPRDRPTTRRTCSLSRSGAPASTWPCGTGNYTTALAATGPRMHGVEISRTMLGAGRSQVGCGVLDQRPRDGRFRSRMAPSTPPCARGPAPLSSAGTLSSGGSPASLPTMADSSCSRAPREQDASLLAERETSPTRWSRRSHTRRRWSGRSSRCSGRASLGPRWCRSP